MLKKAVFLILFGTLFFCICSSSWGKKYSLTGSLFESPCTIDFFTSNSEAAREIKEGLFSLAAGYEKILSSTGKNSQIVMLNHNKEALINAPLLLDTIKDAKFYALVTKGAYDPARYNLLSLWEGAKKGPPADPEIKQQLLFSGYQYLFIENQQVFLKNNVSITLKGIARGKIIGLLGTYLIEKGIKDFLISSEHIFLAKGLYGQDRPWRVDPDCSLKTENLSFFLDARNCSIAYAGQNQHSDSHNQLILDPRTGYPVEKEENVIVIHTNPSRTSPEAAQALAAGFYVMGKERGLELASHLSEVEVIYIYKEEGIIKTVYSEGIECSKGKKVWIYSIFCGKSTDKKEENALSR